MIPPVKNVMMKILKIALNVLMVSKLIDPKLYQIMQHVFLYVLMDNISKIQLVTNVVLNAQLVLDLLDA